MCFEPTTICRMPWEEISSSPLDATPSQRFDECRHGEIMLVVMSQSARTSLPPRVHVFILVDACSVVVAATDLQYHTPLQLHHTVWRVLLPLVTQSQLAKRTVAPGENIASRRQRGGMLFTARYVDYVLVLQRLNLRGHRLQLEVAMAKLPISTKSPRIDGAI